MGPVKNIYNVVHHTYEASFGVIYTIISMIWLGIIVYRLNLIRIKHKQISESHDFKTDYRSKSMYNLTTITTRDLFLFVIILLDIFNAFVIPFIFYYIEKNIEFSNNKEIIIKDYFGCDVLGIIGYSYLHPPVVLYLILLAMMIISQVMLLSYLNSYLAVRYLGYSLHYNVKYKYIYSWIFQCLVQIIFIIPQLQLFFQLIVTILFISNWLNLLISSRKVTRAIRSQMEEIRLFEWNPAHYRNYARSLKYYKLSMFFVISAFLLLILTFIVTMLLFYLQLILTGNCYISRVYQIPLPINFTGSEPTQINYIFSSIYDWLPLFTMMIFGLLFTLPSSIIFLSYLVNFVYGRCTGKVSKNKLTNTLFEPLISKNST